MAVCLYASVCVVFVVHSDPFVELECEGFSALETGVVDNTVNPAFNTTFMYPIRDRRSVVKCTSCGITVTIRVVLSYGTTVTICVVLSDDTTVTIRVVLSDGTTVMIRVVLSYVVTRLRDSGGPVEFSVGFSTTAALSLCSATVSVHHKGLVNKFLGRLDIPVDGFRANIEARVRVPMRARVCVCTRACVHVCVHVCVRSRCRPWEQCDAVQWYRHRWMLCGR